jgi:hypothetical protein
MAANQNIKVAHSNEIDEEEANIIWDEEIEEIKILDGFHLFTFLCLLIYELRKIT